MVWRPPGGHMSAPAWADTSDTSVRQIRLPDTFDHKVTDKASHAPMGCSHAGRRARRLRSEGRPSFRNVQKVGEAEQPRPASRCRRKVSDHAVVAQHR